MPATALAGLLLIASLGLAATAVARRSRRLGALACVAFIAFLVCVALLKLAVEQM